MTDTANDTPVLDLLASMTADSIEASTLDAGTLLLVRVAALVAVGAPPVSYALNLEVGANVGLDADDIRGVLTAIAPIVGVSPQQRATSSGHSPPRSRSPNSKTRMRGERCGGRHGRLTTCGTRALHARPCARVVSASFASPPASMCSCRARLTRSLT